MTRDLTLEELDDYLSGVLPDSEADRFEEALFEAAQRGEDAAAVFLQALERNARWLTTFSHFAEGQQRAAIDALLASGKPVHYAEMGPGGRVDIPVWKPDVKHVVFHLSVDLRGYDAVELDAERPSGTPIMRFRDIDYNRADGSIYAVCLEPVARVALTSGPLRWHVSGARAGKREVVATYETNPT